MLKFTSNLFQVEQARALAVREKFAHEQREEKKRSGDLQETNDRLTAEVQDLNSLLESISVELKKLGNNVFLVMCCKLY